MSKITNPTDQLITNMGTALCPKCMKSFRYKLGYVPICPHCSHEMRI